MRWLERKVKPDPRWAEAQRYRWLRINIDHPDRCEVVGPERIEQQRARAMERVRILEQYNEQLADEVGQLRRRLKDGS